MSYVGRGASRSSPYFHCPGAVDNLDHQGRKPVGYVRETAFPMDGEEGGANFRYGQWSMRALGFQVHVWLSGCRVFHVVEIGGLGPSFPLVIQGAPGYSPFCAISAYGNKSIFGSSAHGLSKVFNPLISHMHTKTFISPWQSPTPFLRQRCATLATIAGGRGVFAKLL